MHAPDLTIRPARRDEKGFIRRLVLGAGLDPTSLKWHNFLVADLDGKLIGCAQVKPYPGCRELGSLVVGKQYRRRGIAAALIRALLENENGDVYLMCRDRLAPYYQRFGFEQIGLRDAPWVIRIKLASGRPMGWLFRIRLVAMRRHKSTKARP